MLPRDGSPGGVATGLSTQINYTNTAPDPPDSPTSKDADVFFSSEDLGEGDHPFKLHARAVAKQMANVRALLLAKGVEVQQLEPAAATPTNSVTLFFTPTPVQTDGRRNATGIMETTLLYTDTEGDSDSANEVVRDSDSANEVVRDSDSANEVVRDSDSANEVVRNENAEKRRSSTPGKVTFKSADGTLGTPSACERGEAPGSVLGTTRRVSQPSPSFARREPQVQAGTHRESQVTQTSWIPSRRNSQPDKGLVIALEGRASTGRRDSQADRPSFTQTDAVVNTSTQQSGGKRRESQGLLQLGSMSNAMRRLVSKKKRRFQEDGFDLDLTYITDNIIAMGFPAEKLEGVYRNSMEDVIRFLDTRHPNSYRVYNLCSERSYDPRMFHNQVACFPFDDHNAPPFHLIGEFCNDVLKFLSSPSDTQKVIAIHCKAGKGRTGVMICCLLMHLGLMKESTEALDFYGHARTYNGKGVTIPSQIRYVHYYGRLLAERPTYKPIRLSLRQITLHTIPVVGRKPANVYCVVTCGTRKAIIGLEKDGAKKNDKTIVLQPGQPITVEGDVKVELLHKDSMGGKGKLLHFWFNTYFVRDMALALDKSELDKANKDKDKIFRPNFRLVVDFEPYTGTDGVRFDEQVSVQIVDQCPSSDGEDCADTAQEDDDLSEDEGDDVEWNEPEGPGNPPAPGGAPSFLQSNSSASVISQSDVSVPPMSPPVGPPPSIPSANTSNAGGILSTQGGFTRSNTGGLGSRRRICETLNESDGEGEAFQSDVRGVLGQSPLGGSDVIVKPVGRRFSTQSTQSLPATALLQIGDGDSANSGSVGRGRVSDIVAGNTKSGGEIMQECGKGSAFGKESLRRKTSKITNAMPKLHSVFQWPGK